LGKKTEGLTGPLGSLRKTVKIKTDRERGFEGARGGSQKQGKAT